MTVLVEGGGGRGERSAKKWGPEMFCFGLCPDAPMRPYWVQKIVIFETVICLPTKLRSSKNWFKCAFYIESEFVGFWRPRGKPECAVKNLSEQGREPTTISTQIWCLPGVSTPRFEPGRHNWWEGSASLTAAPALLPRFVEVRHMKGDYQVDLAQRTQS